VGGLGTCINKNTFQLKTLLELLLKSNLKITLTMFLKMCLLLLNTIDTQVTHRVKKFSKKHLEERNLLTKGL
jgi:hypothetical protein